MRGAIAVSIRGRGRTPTIAQVATDLSLAERDVDASFGRMIEERVFIPRKGSREIYAYNPFCAEPTDFAVTAGGRLWWAICAWDALGIPAALGADGVIETRCGDCREPIAVEVDAQGVANVDDWTVMQVGVPARDFWKDIYHT